MAYNTEDLFNQAMQIIDEEKPHFIVDLISSLPCSPPTFYDHFPKDSNKFKQLKDLIDKNAIDLKKQLRKKWKDSDNATLQMALYKLLASDEERKKLAQTFHDHTSDGEQIGFEVNWSKGEKKKG